MAGSIALIKASDGTGNASVATVQSSRSPGSTTLTVDTVDNIPATFMGTMGTPHTFTDPVTSETITVISEATAVDFSGHVSTTHLEIDTIAPGYTDLGSAVGDIIIIRPTTQYADNLAGVLEVAHNDDGTIKTVPQAALPASTVMQYVYTQTGAVATGTTTIPYDDTIPQNTEGNQFMTLAITPKSATDILKIEVLAWVSGPAGDAIGALFQDSTANALAAVNEYMDTANGRRMLKITYTMVAGTTSATTFKFRAGSSQAGTMTFNGSGGNRFMGGVAGSSITITEYKA